MSELINPSPPSFTKGRSKQIALYDEMLDKVYKKLILEIT